MSWPKIKLAELSAGRTVSLNPAKHPEELFSLYSIPGFDRGTPDVAHGHEIGSAKQLLLPGDILLSKIVPHIRRSWVVKAPRENERLIGSGEWIVFRSDRIDPDYLSKVLVSDDFHSDFMGTVAGVGGSLLRARPKAVMQIEIPLPPLEDQKRIAVVLDKADTLRRQRQESLELTEKLLQSVFIDMFVRSPAAETWNPQSVQWMASNKKGAIRTGPFGSQLLHSEFVDDGIAVLGIDNAVSNKFEWGKPRFITPAKYEDLKRYRVYPGDVLITIMGTNGRCAVVPDDIPEAINTKHICCISLDREKCLPEFLHAAFLNHPHVLRQLGVRAKGAVMPGLNMGIIKGLEIPLPPIEMQFEFVRITRIQRILVADGKISQGYQDDLFRSLQQRAFSGELDLRKIKIELETEVSSGTIVAGHSYREGIFNRPGYFIAPPEVEERLMKLEYQLDTGPGESIPWSEDYFKYRILSQLLKPPYSFSEIWDRVYYDIENPDYEIVKAKLFEYIEAGILQQQFDQERKEIVFHPRP